MSALIRKHAGERDVFRSKTFKDGQYESNLSITEKEMVIGSEVRIRVEAADSYRDPHMEVHKIVDIEELDAMIAALVALRETYQ